MCFHRRDICRLMCCKTLQNAAIGLEVSDKMFLLWICNDKNFMIIGVHLFIERWKLHLIFRNGRSMFWKTMKFLPLQIKQIQIRTSSSKKWSLNSFKKIEPHLFWRKMDSYDHGKIMLFYIREILLTNAVHDSTKCCQWSRGVWQALLSMH